MSQVRISENTHIVLRDLSHIEDTSMQEIIEKAVEQYRRRRFLEGLSDDFLALRGDPQMLEEYEAELETWDNTIADGLNSE